MAISFVNLGGITQNANGSLAFPWPASIAVGDLVLAVITWNLRDLGFFDDPQGGLWHLVSKIDFGTNPRGWLYWHLVNNDDIKSAAEGGTVRWTRDYNEVSGTRGGSGGGHGHLIAYRGVDDQIFSDVSGQANASSTTVTAPGIDPNPNDWVLFIGHHEGLSVTASGYSGTNPTFSNERLDVSHSGNGYSTFIADGTSDGAATGSRTATLSSASANAGRLIALKEAGESPYVEYPRYKQFAKFNENFPRR